MSKDNRAGKDSGNKASLLTDLIYWFDSYVALYTVDPIRIQKALKGYVGTDIERIWQSVKTDFDEIVELPERSKEVEKVSRRASNTRRISFLVAIITFVFLIVYVLEDNFKFLGYDVTLIIPGVMIGLLYATFMLSITSTRGLNKTMRKYYDEHSKELTKQKSHIHDATQQLIDRLSREVYSHGFEPSRFKFKLYNTNYKNIAVLSQRGDKYISTIKPRK